MTNPESGLPPSPSGQAPPKSDGDGGGGLRQWLIDTYNGLYVIVLKPRMPESILYWMAIIGVLLGIIWTFFFPPVVWTGGNPNRLNEDSQRQWLLMTAVGTSAQNLYGPEQLVALAQAVPNPSQQIQAMLDDPNTSQNDRIALQALQTQLPADVDAGSAPDVTSGNLLGYILTVWILPIIVMIILVIVITLLWRFLIYDNLVAPVLQSIAEARDPELRARNQKARDELKIMQDQAKLREQLKRESVASELGEPVMTQLAIYTPGRIFDESYEIELESGEFLGQSGAVIAESVDPDPVAVEVWLFDMFSSRNLARVFVTPQGNADPSIRSRLEADVDNPATDIIVAQANTPLTIDTDKLRLEAKFASLDINANGRFENFNLQMRAWNKDAATASTPAPAIPSTPSAPAVAPDMSVYDDIQFDPPPPMPSGGASGRPDMSTYDNIQFDPPPPMPSSGKPDMSVYDDIQFDPPPPMPSGNMQPPSMTPLSPPPLMPNNNDDDDDPFGGTADFTPIPPNT